jgi:ribosomal protein S16
MQAAPSCLVVAVQSRKELDAALDEAVGLLKPASVTQHVGISVTRLALERHEARLNTDVPPGTTIERWASEPR